MSVENIQDHRALACTCGSTRFALLQSGGIECHQCGEKVPQASWLAPPAMRVGDIPTKRRCRYGWRHLAAYFAGVATYFAISTAVTYLLANT